MTCIRGKANVVTFRSTAEKILKQFAQNKEKDIEAEKASPDKNCSFASAFRHKINGCLKRELSDKF